MPLPVIPKELNFLIINANQEYNISCCMWQRVVHVYDVGERAPMVGT